jgi:hypothetical protein
VELWLRLGAISSVLVVGFQNCRDVDFILFRFKLYIC